MPYISYIKSSIQCLLYFLSTLKLNSSNPSLRQEVNSKMQVIVFQLFIFFS